MVIERFSLIAVWKIEQIDAQAAFTWFDYGSDIGTYFVQMREPEGIVHAVAVDSDSLLIIERYHLRILNVFSAVHWVCCGGQEN